MIDLLSRKIATMANTNATSALAQSTTNAVLPTLRGAVGSGASATADQAGWNAAIAAITATQSATPSGSIDYTTYQSGALIEPGIYDAGNFTQANNFESVRLIAKVPGTVIIRIPAGQYFLTVSGRVNQIVVDGITFVGGLGAFNFTNLNNNVNLQMSFTRNVFYNYTQCAITNNSNDHPYLRVQNNIFSGAAGSKTIGVAWGGYVDQGLIEHNAFLQDAYHLKIGPRISSSMMIQHNDFISWGDATNRTQADIWLVPNSDANSFGTNSGYGTSIMFNKFGLENQNLAAPRILIAVENTAVGNSRATWFPSTSTVESPIGYLSQVLFENNTFAACSGVTAPVILSYISSLRGIRWVGNRFNGAAYTHIVKFALPRFSDYSNNDSVFDFDASDATSGGTPAQMFSNASFAILRDWAGFFPGDQNAVDVWPSSDNANAVVLLNGVSASARPVFSGSTMTAWPDPRGTSDFSLVTAGAAGAGVCAALLSVPAGGGMAFVELTLAQAPTRNAGQVCVDICNYSTQIYAMKRCVTLPATNGRLSIPVWLPPSTTPSAWQLRVYATAAYAAGTADQFITGDWIVNTGTGRKGYSKLVERYALLPRNRGMYGGAVGTWPNGWTMTATNGLAGLTATVSKVGCDATGPFLDVAIAGTTTAAGAYYLRPDISNSIEAAPGQTWQFCWQMYLKAGSFANFTAQTGVDGTSGPLALDTVFYTSASTYIADRIVTTITPTATLANYGGSSTAIVNASTAAFDPALMMKFALGVSVAATLRIYVPVIRRMA